MRLTHLTSGDYRRVLWKNGGGMSTELLAEPNDAGGFLWRLSIAEVSQSGPYSDFTGYERTITLLDGAGFTLAFDPRGSNGAPAKRIVRPLKTYSFDGGWPTECTLVDGPIRHFNLIAARSGGPARMSVLELDGGSSFLPASATTVVHLLYGRANVADREMQEGDTLRIDDSMRTIELEAGDSVAAVVIQIGKRNAGH